MAFFVLGLPFETPRTLRKTFDFIKKIAEYPFTTFLLTAVATPLPDTFLWTKYIPRHSKLRMLYYRDKNGKLIEPTWKTDEIAKDFVNHCCDVSVDYDLIKRIQRDIYHLRPEIFSTWSEEDFK